MTSIFNFIKKFILPIFYNINNQIANITTTKQLLLKYIRLNGHKCLIISSLRTHFGGWVNIDFEGDTVRTLSSRGAKLKLENFLRGNTFLYLLLCIPLMKYGLLVRLPPVSQQCGDFSFKIFLNSDVNYDYIKIFIAFDFNILKLILGEI